MAKRKQKPERNGTKEAARNQPSGSDDDSRKGNDRKKEDRRNTINPYRTRTEPLTANITSINL